MTPQIETKEVPPRGSKGSNQAIIRKLAEDPARWVVEGDRRVLKGSSHLCETRSKANSFWSSARKMGLKMVRRTEDGGTRCWVIERENK